MNKKLIIGGPKLFDLTDNVVNELKKMGFEVTDVTYEPHFPYKYKKLSDKIYNFYRKTFFNDYQYKTKLRIEKWRDEFQHAINSVDHFEYALFFRPDYYPIDLLQQIKSKTDQFIAYYWDGLKYFPKGKPYIGVFDRFYIFDPEDINERTLPATNFFLEDESPKLDKEDKSIYFVGGYSNKRYKMLKKVYEVCHKTEWNIDIVLVASKNTHVKKHRSDKIKVTKQSIPFSEYLSRNQKSDVILDVSKEKHNGLSFRVFEAIGTGKKLISSNPHIRDYDFYHSSNCFVLEKNFEEPLKDFLQKPYVPLPDHIKEKYSFGNWIKYILNIHPHQPIKLP
ncbi:MAG: hypothetical protein QM727_01820 [Niabella sp.]